MAAALALAVACGDGDSGTPPTTPGTDTGTPGNSVAGLPQPTLSMGTLEMAVGEQGEVGLEVLEFDEPGLGAWTFDIQYDPAIVSIVSCETTPATSVCNTEYAPALIRIAGAVGVGIVGDTIVANIGFQCEAEGASPLDVTVDTLADGTIGDPRIVTATVENGEVVCEA